MYPMPTPQMPPITPTTPFASQGMMQGAQHLSRMPLQQGAAIGGQSGGLLGKLLGGAQAGAGGGGLTNIVGMLQNAQKAIGIFQQVSPLVQQYGPLVKSLPALINIMRSNGNEDDEQKTEASTPNESNSETKLKTEQVKKKKTTKKKGKQKKSQAKKMSTQKTNSTEIGNGIPAPKLYI
ncbi:hypothetical protein BKP35_03890 [Anaerobacillus arseniciselenatis]|uniref:YqfQ-like protein n=2 Tax=Anaerobacillus arseniciselenatis TaxID=85682 RepID=A0A1S2LWU3_9BACI|nr:hypothetical protein BKP35_03890 [Anaerobacillus arseniciselenatis]